jgi:hypothetical protein
MIKLTFLREEDYWLLPVSIFAILFMTLALYAGVNQLRIIGVVLGIPGLVFTTSIIRRGYDQTHAAWHLFICLSSSILLALGIHLLTN